MSKKTTYDPVAEVSEGVMEQKYYRYGKKGIKRCDKSQRGFQGDTPWGRERIRVILEEAKASCRALGLSDNFKVLLDSPGKFDDAYLLGKILFNAESISAGKIGQDTVIEFSFWLGLHLKDFYDLQAMICKAEGPRKGKSLGEDVNRAMNELGDDVSNAKIIAWLSGEKIAQQRGNKIVTPKGREMKIESFRRMVSRIRKKRKEARKINSK